MPWCAPVKNPKAKSIFVALEKLNILWSSFIYKLNRGEFQELYLRWSKALTLDPKVFWSLGKRSGSHYYTFALRVLFNHFIP
jgi:hypothetical protein